MKAVFAAAAAVCLAALPASASVMFDFTIYGDGGQEELVQTVDGLTVTVTAGAYGFDNQGALGFFIPDVDGIIPGVIDIPDLVVSTQDGSGFGSGDAGIGVALEEFPWAGPDIQGLTDLLTFTFSKAVNFAEVTFGNVDGNDDFDFFVDGVLQTPSDRPIAGNNPFSLTGFTGTSISFGADDFSFRQGVDNFNIQKMTVAAVPVPATAALALLGVAGFAGYRRVQKKKTA